MNVFEPDQSFEELAGKLIRPVTGGDPSAGFSKRLAREDHQHTLDTSFLQTVYSTGYKNLIINGDFRINQRNVTSTSAWSAFGADRWQGFVGGGASTFTLSHQNFTPGVGPQVGFEPEKYLRFVTASVSGVDNYAFPRHYIEDLRTISGSTATISFWARAGSGTPIVAVEFERSFGTGGAPTAPDTFYCGQVLLSTNWQRFSLTVTVPSTLGKVFGTNNDSRYAMNVWCSGGTNFIARTGGLGLQNNTFDFWGVQVERGTSVTTFEQRHIQQELALCQRYYYRSGVFGPFNYTERFAPGVNFTNVIGFVCMHPIELRTNPALIITGQPAVDNYGVAANITHTATFPSTRGARLSFSTTGLVDYRPYFLIGNNSIDLQWSAEW